METLCLAPFHSAEIAAAHSKHHMLISYMENWMVILKNYQGALFIERCCGKVCYVADLHEALKVYGGQSLLFAISVPVPPLWFHSFHLDLLCQGPAFEWHYPDFELGRYSELSLLMRVAR